MVALHNILIAGSGIVGNSLAYFFAKRNVPVTIIDPVGIAPGASRKAGGFLARDWRDGTILQEIQQQGFDLHQELANDLGSERIGYRRLTCMSVSIQEDNVVSHPKQRQDLEWVDRGVINAKSIGEEDTIAQVHPLKLCEAMWDYAESTVGSKLKIGRVTKVCFENDSETLKGVELDDGTTIDAKTLIVACGPWTEQSRSWFPKHLQCKIPQITGVKCHSILIRAPKTLNQAVFFEGNGPLLGSAGLEVYPRPDGDAYVNGFEGNERIVDEKPGQEQIESQAIDKLQTATDQTTSVLEGLEPHTRQAGYWPETPDGFPILDKIIDGAYLATGHSVWGILQGPITGKAMCELVLDGKATCIDLKPFQLDRFSFYDDDSF